MAAATTTILLLRSTPHHDAYTVRVADRRFFTVLATARPADARRWVYTSRWLHPGLIRRGRLIVGLGVQWTAPLRPLDGPPVPATLQLCVGSRCLVFHLARAAGVVVPQTLRRFLADPRITFVGHGSANDCRMLAEHFGIHVARGHELRAMAGMGNASMEAMADQILGYPGISKSRDVAMSDWDAPRRLSVDHVLYAALDAFIAYRLGVHLCPRPPDFGSRVQVVVERSPPTQAFCGLAILAEEAPPSDSEVAAANNTSSSKVVDTAGAAGLTLTGSGTTDGDAAATTTHGLLVRADASDCDDDSADDGFDRVAIEASDDDDEFYVLL